MHDTAIGAASFHERGVVRPMNVLVVDDDRAIRSVLRIAFALEETVGEVRDATDGAAARAALREFTPDVVVIGDSAVACQGREIAHHARALHPHAMVVSFSGPLGHKPEWADEHFGKGHLPGADVVVDLARSERRVSV